MASAGKLARDHRSEVRQGNMLEGLLVTSPETPEDHVLTRVAIDSLSLSIVGRNLGGGSMRPCWKCEWRRRASRHCRNSNDAPGKKSKPSSNSSRVKPVRPRMGEKAEKKCETLTTSYELR